MAKFLFLDLVNQYIDDEKKRNKDMRSKSAIYKWIIDDVRDELISINEQYREIDNDDTDAKKVFRDTIIAQFETAHFRKFLKNKSDTKTTHYQNLLYSCFISSETIEDFLEAKRDSNSGTLDFFKAFCQYQEREYGKKTSMPIPIREYPSIPDDIKTETFLIPGATIIDKAFIEKVKSGKTFTMPEFYGAKQNNYCQWYGIIHDYDVERKGCQKLKETLLDSFIEEKDGKVSAIVHGSGGSGKSTVLRRIAVDFHQESFAVIWLERSRVEEFVKSGLLIIKNEIEKNYNRKFLIIIEDWYRMFDDEDKLKLGTKILEITYEMNNVRIVIGDRELKNEYKKYRNNNVELLLSSEDNKEIFERIIEKYPNWKEASERLFTKEKNYESSMFLLLFILAHIDQKEFNQESLDFSEPQQVFQNIIESDLRFIERKYKGLAKALYYWGCIYAEHKGFITYETFLKIADYYNEKDTNEISDFFSRWNMKNTALERLKNYVNNVEKHGNKNVMQFNHDILADKGLRCLKIENWEEFDDTIKIQLLKIISDKGDDFSASMFLGQMLSKEPQIFKNQQEKLYFIKKLINKNNRHKYYISELLKLKLDNQTLEEYAQLIWDKKIFYFFFWHRYFLIIENDTIIKNHILEILSNIEAYEPNFISVVWGYAINKEEKYTLAELFFEKTDASSMSPYLINLFLPYVNHKKRKAYAKDKIKNVDIFQIQDHYEDLYVIRQCLGYVSKSLQAIFSTTLLHQDNWKLFKDFSLVLQCLNYVDNETRLSFFEKVLLEKDAKIIENFFKKCRTFSSKEISDLFITTALKNTEGEHPGLISHILFMEGIGLGGYV